MTRRTRALPLLLGLLLGCRGREPARETLPTPETSTATAGSEASPRSPHAPSKIVDVAAGGTRTCAILEDGTVRCWGSNERGELGVGEESSRPSATPRPLAGLAHVRRVVLHDWHGCALDEAGAIACWGWGQDGSLGFHGPDGCPNGPRYEPCALSPRPVPGLGAPAIDVAVGNMHTCAVLQGGRVACWGDGEHGKLGFTPTEEGRYGPSAFSPGRVPGLAQVKQVSLGFNHTCALHDDGGVSCWGSNDFGQLGRGTHEELPHVAPARVPGLSGVVQIAASALDTCARMSDGTVRCWGSGRNGKVGGSVRRCGSVDCAPSPVVVDGVAGARDLAAMAGIVCALLDDGSARCWGAEHSDAMHLDAPPCPVPDSGYAESCARAPSLVRDVPPLSRLATSAGHTCAISRSGELWCWGHGEDRALGFEPRCAADAPRCIEPPRRVTW